MSRGIKRVIGLLLLFYCLYALFMLSRFYWTHSAAIYDLSRDGRLKLFALALSLFGTVVLGGQLVRDLVCRRSIAQSRSEVTVARPARGVREIFLAAWHKHPLLTVLITALPFVLIILLILSR
jgi:hypothetical protein